MMSARGLIPWGTVIHWTQSCFILLVFLIVLPEGANAVLGGGKDRDNCQRAFDGIEKQLQTEALGAFINSNSPSRTTFTNFSLKYQIFVEKAVWYRLCEGQAVLAADWQNENNEGVLNHPLIFPVVKSMPYRSMGNRLLPP